MRKFIIEISRKYFSNYFAQNNCGFFIQTKPLAAHFFKKKNIEKKDCSKFVKTQK